MKRDPAQRAVRAAEQLQAWLDDYVSPPRPAAGDVSIREPSAAERNDAGRSHAGPDTDAGPSAVSLPGTGAPTRKLAPAHTDWLYHHLTVTGPADQLVSFRTEAAGAGVIPWRLDLDRMEEDFFLRLMAPQAGGKRTLSLEGARMLAAELREAVGRRHALATAGVGRRRVCPFDLHALLPVPEEMLRLGPDHPDALAWLWTHWGTTDALRHVVSRPSPAAGGEALRLSFWAADWTPWRALETIRAEWPGLRFDMRPVYELT